MVEKLKNNIKREKGITLVALVVTIIVLLILAFISISMLMGENGIINKASESKEETIKAKEREIIQLTYQDLEMEYTLNGTDITADRVWEKLKEYDNNIKVEMKAKEELGETEIVVEKNSGEEYAEITYTETGHKYAGSLVIDENKARYEVTYNANKGYGGPTKQIKIEGMPLTITGEMPERKGYSFKGWSKDSTAVLAEYVIGSQYTEDANVTLYAVWQLREDIEPVAQIGDTKYPSIQEAVYACSQEAGETATTIILLKNTEEEFKTFEGQNIILDLQGYTVTSESTRAICTNNGKIQIENGELRNNNGTTIINNGEITIGNNSNGIDDNTPTIYGKNVGIENNGIFNFYDGKIQGIIPIQGETTSTPDQYGPVQTGSENGITTVQLRILTQYEARIGWVYYETLQGAVDIAKEKETVTLIKDLQLKEALEVSESKDIILDLYGYSLTVSPGQETVIKNDGNLEVTDSSIEQTGKIKITSDIEKTSYYNEIYTTGIYNSGNHNIKIRGGTIEASSTGTYNHATGIYNENNGLVEVIGGIVSSTASRYLSDSNGIYNNNTGTVMITGGTVTSNNSGFLSYGIYNNDTGNIIVENGTINSHIDSAYDSYGIYNNNGTVEIKGGTINSSGSKNNCDSNGIYNNTGNIKIENGTVISSNNGNNSNGIYNNGIGNIEIEGGTIRGNASRGDSSGIYNNDIGNIEIKGGVIESNNNSNINDDNSYGIYNLNEGNIVIEDGTIVSTSSNRSDSYGIYNDNTGTVIIGIEENKIALQDKPSIKAEYTQPFTEAYKGYGIYNQLGKVEFYSGVIKGNKALIGTITKIREGYQLEKNTIEEKDSIYLVKKINEEYIVQIENTKYKSLQEAIDSVGEDEEKTIEVLKSFELNEQINFNKNIILDLKGFTITNNYYKLENKANLNIKDSTENKQGKIENINTVIGILNSEEGSITLKEGTINSINECDGSTYGIYNNSIGNIIVEEGTISSSNNYEYSDDFTIYNNNTGKIEIKGGAISSKNTWNGDACAIYNKIGNVIIEQGKVTGEGGGDIIYNLSGNVEIYGGNIEGNIDSIITNSSGNVVIDGGTLKGSDYGIYNGAGRIEMRNGTINSNKYGIYTNGIGSIEAKGGIISGELYGIYNRSTGSIIIGTKGDGITSQEEPYVKGIYTGTSSSSSGYGIYNTKGTLYFYDGKIEGSKKAVYDIITEIEENTELNYNEDETILTLSTTITDVAQIENITYPTLQEAIDAVGNKQTTIKILKDVMYISKDTEIIIQSNKDIILDLNGHKITSSIPEQAIKNEGILEITDTSQEQTGIIITSEEITIKNIENAKLTISGGTIENRTRQSIYNEGELIIKKGTINCNGEKNKIYGIYNNNTGNVIMEDGVIIMDSNNQNFSGYGIFNNSTENIIVKGGTISYNTSQSHNYGIYNANTGNIEVIGGTISSGGYNHSYGIYNDSTGNIIVGTKEDGITSQEEPYIKGEYTLTASINTGYGIYNSEGNLYYYDGKIEGTIKAIEGNISEVEEGTELSISVIETENNVENEVITLEQKEEKVARVNGVEYDSIQKAVQACGETERTIEILRDSEPGATIIVGENQNITIDLKGHIINNYTELQNKGTLKIVDTSSEQSGKIVGLTGTAILNTGTMTLESGGIADSGYGIQNTGKLNITGGNISNNSYGIYNNGSGITTITGGNINSNTYGIYNYASNSTINVDGGNIASNQYGIYNSNGTTNISGTGINNNDYGIYNAGGITNIKEGTQVQSNTGIYSAGGTVNIGEQGTMNPDSPIIIGETYGLRVASTGTVYMYDGQVKGKEGATEGYITYTEEGYVVANREEGEYKVNYLALGGTANAVAQVNGVSYSNLQSAINSITGREEQTITLLNGIIAEEIYEISEGQNIVLDMNGKTITTDLEIAIKNSGSLTIVDTSNKNVASITSTTGVAIENSGTLTLGEDDGTENPNLIIIEGATHGITNTGTLNVYDGTIRPE